MMKFAKEYLIMTLGLAVFVFGWVAFLNPHEITGGGIAGLASVIHYGLPKIPISYAKFAIDALLLVFGFIILGRGFGIKTIYCVVMSFVLFHFMPMIPGLVEFSAGIEENLINALIGGALSGIGISIIFTQGGSTGGTDIVALSINKYKNISPGRIYLVCDSLIIISILLLPDKSLQDVVYGYIEIIAFSYAVDMMTTGSQQSVQTLIVSKKNREIAQQLNETSVEGSRPVYSVQWALQDDQEVLMVVSRKNSSNEITKLAKAVDPDVFMMTVPVTAVYGVERKSQ
ncbi:MAG: YitT family protein [Bacteroidales bacterium]|nr:YitT family protein [Bacteroidales bacterium]